jgi:hypothetical protein
VRFARSALNPYSVALDVPPASSVLKFFLYREWHMFPRCRKQRRMQAIALHAWFGWHTEPTELLRAACLNGWVMLWKRLASDILSELTSVPLHKHRESQREIAFECGYCPLPAGRRIAT